MSVLNKIAYYQDRRDEVPNQELARELAASGDTAGIQEIAENLWNKNKNVQSDCLKVLYEIGYIDPKLIAGYVEDFLKLLKSKYNRMVWGAMIALGTIAEKRPHEIWAKIDDVIHTVDQGTVIMIVWGVKVLAAVAAADENYSRKLFPVLINQLQKCIPRDVPTHAESMLCAVNAGNRQEFLAVLTARQPEMSPAQVTRLKKVIRALQGR
jgi:uncharacterized protein (DUF2235 family)